jgi:two-component system chemotaxis response regulator CheY
MKDRDRQLTKRTHDKHHKKSRHAAAGNLFDPRRHHCALPYNRHPGCRDGHSGARGRHLDPHRQIARSSRSNRPLLPVAPTRNGNDRKTRVIGMQLSPQKEMRVLIAEDDKPVAGTLAAMVKSSKHDVVEIVASGLEAIHAYERHKPDVVVMDYLMSRLNGVTACRNILAKDPSARIILVSGAIGPQELSLSHSGAIAILQKPISVAQIQEVLDTLASHQTPPPFGETIRPLRRI